MKTVLDQLIDTRYNANQPGGTVLIAKNGRIQYQRAFGLANLDEQVSIRHDTLFNIGSQTKQFTAVRILQLMEQGKLSVVEPISKYISHCAPAWSDITIENLLTHSSGISDLGVNRSLSFESKMDSAMKKPLAYKPGTKTFYANIEFEILGYIVEKVTGESMAVNFRKYIIGPLGLKNTYAPVGKDTIWGLIPCYVKRSDGGYNGSDNRPAGGVGGAGGLISNTKDMMIWYEALATGKLIKKETLAKAWQPFVLTDGMPSKYGYGWDAGGDVQGSPIAEHGGLAFGFVTGSIYLINEHVYVGVFLNHRDYADATAQELAAIFLGKPYPTQQIELSSDVLQSYAGTYQDNGGAKKLFSLKDGKLYYEPDRARPSRLVPYQKDRFYLENTLVVCDFVRDSQGKITGIHFADRRYSKQAGWQWKRVE